jgi:hypothetical protein
MKTNTVPKAIPLAFFLPLLMLIGFSSVALAAPAAHVAEETLQPNGKNIDIYLTGDEWFNYYTDSADNPILEDTEGYWRYVVADNNSKLALGEIVTKNSKLAPAYTSDHKITNAEMSFEDEFRDLRSSITGISETAVPIDARQSFLLEDSSGLSTSSFETLAVPSSIPVLVIRVGFTNATFSVADSHFTNQLFTGAQSMKNFYLETSNSKLTFTPAAESYGTANDGMSGLL